MKAKKFYDPTDCDVHDEDRHINQANVSHETNHNITTDPVDQLLSSLTYEELVGISSHGYPHGVISQDRGEVKKWMKDFKETFNETSQPMKSTHIYATRAWRRVIHPDVNINTLKKFFLGRPK